MNALSTFLLCLNECFRLDTPIFLWGEVQNLCLSTPKLNPFFHAILLRVLTIAHIHCPITRTMLINASEASFSIFVCCLGKTVPEQGLQPVQPALLGSWLRPEWIHMHASHTSANTIALMSTLLLLLVREKVQLFHIEVGENISDRTMATEGSVL